MLLELSKQKQQLEQSEQQLQEESITVQDRRRKTALERGLEKARAQLDAIDEMVRQVRDERRRPIFSFRRYFHEVFNPADGSEGGFHIILANPPYVRADAQFNYLEDEQTRQEAIRRWKNYRTAIIESGFYRTLHEKWDLYIVFLERAFQLLRPNGYMVFIISDAYNAAKYATKSHEFFLEQATIERIDFCSDIPLFEVGVKNTILHISKTTAPASFHPLRVQHIGRDPDEFDQHIKLLPPQTQKKLGPFVFRPIDALSMWSHHLETIRLGDICYVSKGAVVHANERSHHGAFRLEDLLSPVKDELHSRSFVLGRDISRWHVNHLRYIEWGTERAPGQFSRPTFSALHTAKERLLSRRISLDRVIVAYDDRQLYANHQATIFVPWHYLKEVRNKSIQKTAKYRDEMKPSLIELTMPREDLEALSLDFAPKYLLAIMNSSFARQFLKGIRQSTKDIFPDEWKKLPIACIPLSQQKDFVGLVDAILREYDLYGPSLSDDAAKRVLTLEKELDEKIFALYTSAPEEMAKQEQVQITEVAQNDAGLDEDADLEE